jgi:pilus assembly protein CpaD
MTISKLTFAALFIGTSVALGACSSVSQDVPAYRLNPTTVAESVERLELYARPNGLTLSARDQSAVAQFIQTYAATGSGPIFINRPAGHGGGLGVQETDRMLRTVMSQVGVNPSAAQTGEYFVRPGDPAPVVVSYKTLRTVPQDCGSLGSVTDVRNNGVSPEFGCFMSANMAAMISDPRQLIAPLPQGTPNAQRRQVIYDLYIEGQATAAQRPTGQQQNSQSTG